MWDHNRLAREWDAQCTQVLQTDYNESLATTIELFLASPMFLKLGPNAQDLLSVVAFFPQGVDESNLDWLFPTISNTQNIFDKFCTLSLTYQSNGFTTMLAPLQDYLCPKDPKSSPLLCTTKGCYFSRLSADLDPDEPSFEETKWIMSEDVWNTCASFMEHLYRHKPQLVTLGPRVEGLPDNHPSKPNCLFHLSRLFDSVGNNAECKWLLVHTLELHRGQGSDLQVAETLRALATANLMLDLYPEGIEQAKESLEIVRWLNNTSQQAESLQQLAWLLYGDGQLDAAEEVVYQSINLLPEGEQFKLCQSYDLLGDIYHSKGETEKAINHYGTALGIASSFNWHDQQFWILYSLAELFFDQERFDEAHAHIEHAKSHTVNDPYLLGCGMEQQAGFWYRECKLEEAKSEVLGAIGIYEKLGAAMNMESCRKLLQEIESK
jgi:tetratricopeptide (TPR) repeat protein